MKRSLFYLPSLCMFMLVSSSSAHAGRCNMTAVQSLSAKVETISAQIQTLQTALQSAQQTKPSKDAAMTDLLNRIAAAKARYNAAKTDKVLRTQIRSELNGLSREKASLKKLISGLAKTIKTAPPKIAKLQRTLNALGQVIDTQAYYCYVESAGCEYGTSQTRIGTIPVGVCDRGNRVEEGVVWAYYELYFRSEPEMGAFLAIVGQNDVVTFSGTNSQGYWQVNLKERR